jgi:hypothetical protein
MRRKTNQWLWVVVLWQAAFPGHLFAQAKLVEVPRGAPLKLPAAHGTGRRIPSEFELLWFRLPLFAHVTKGADADYVHYSVRYGPKESPQWLGFYFGPLMGGYEPHDPGNASIKWTARDLICDNVPKATDWRGSTPDGRRWRHMGIVFGFADYQDVSPDAAHYFDKILDSASCGKMP